MTNKSSIEVDSIIPWRDLFRREYAAAWNKIKNTAVDATAVEGLDLRINYNDSLSLEDVYEKIISNARHFDISLSRGDAKLFLANFTGIYTNLVREFDLDFFFEACLCCQILADRLTGALRTGNYAITETTSTVAGTGEIKLAGGWTIGIYIRYAFRGIDYIFFPDGTRLFNDGINSEFAPTDLMPQADSENLFNLLTGQ